MKIEVNGLYSNAEDITVVVNGKCNHAGKYEEDLDYGYASTNRSDWIDIWQNTWVCDKCDWTKLIEVEE